MPIDIPQGPLITPHTPNITGAESPKLENVGAGIVAAAAKGAEINGRTRALEASLYKMQLSEQNKDIQHGLAMMRMAQDNDQYQRSQFLREKDHQRKQGDSDFRERKYYDTLKDQGDYMAEVATVDPNDPLAWNKTLQIESRHAAGASTPGGRRVKFWIGDQYNKRTAAEKTAANSDLKQIDNYVKLWNWQGFKPTSEPLDNPDYWVPAFKSNPDGTPVLDKDGKMEIDPTHKTYMIGKDQLGNARYITQPTEVIDDYLSRWKRAKTAFNKEQITDYTSGVRPYPVDHTAGTAGAMPLPTDRTQWIMHQPYTIKGKTYMYDGANLIPVQ